LIIVHPTVQLFYTNHAPSHVAKIAIVQQDDEDETLVSGTDDRTNKLEQQHQQHLLSLAQHGQG